MRWIVCLLMMFGLAGLLVVGGNVAVAEIRPEFAMDSDPELTIPNPIKQFSKKYKSLWLAALARPEADMQRLAAETIAEAHLVGVPEMSDARTTLLKIAAADESHSAARTSAARALIVLETKEASQVLFDASEQHGADLRQVIEPALAHWRFEPIRVVWLKRLDVKPIRHRELMLAINGLGEAGDKGAVPRLLTLVHDSFRPASARLAAARAVGILQESGLEANAEELAKPESASIADRLIAAALLGRHKSDGAQAVLLRLARDKEPSVIAAALIQLNAINHDLVLPLADQAIAHGDVNVRRQGANAYIARPTPERIVVLAKLLDDVHPELRASVREALFVLAQKPELDSAIRQSSSDVLAGEGWRGQEQATLLLSVLDHKPVASRLVQLLESPRREVLVVSAWGLRKLAVPETFPAMLNKAIQQTEIRLKQPAAAGVDEQVAHLFEAFGLLKYAPAEGLLRQYVPKVMPLGDYSRGAAIWSLGLLHNGVPDEALAVLMAERLTEPPVTPPELIRVRTMSAISLGRMQAKSQVKRMRDYLGSKVEPMITPLAIRWAIHQLTGELLPDAEPSRTSKSGWFLEPLDD
ncbi:MAG: HEAT repeat domain-containing protein [Planctomycetia bacterium]|nr:HEAT repeat domain-containing protein [Planctomycetia bacterium]